MEVKDVLKRLERNRVFTAWRQKNPGAILSTLFTVDGGAERRWQAGLYDSKSDTVTTFVVDKEITQTPPEKVLKMEGASVKELFLARVNIDADAALAAAEALQKQKYRAEMPIKRIVILQNLELGQVYNITYVTRSFKTLNMKVDAATGAIVQNSLISLVQFEKRS